MVADADAAPGREPARTREALERRAGKAAASLEAWLEGGGDDARAEAFWALSRGAVDDATRRAVLEALNARGAAVAGDALAVLRSGLGDDALREGCLDLLTCCGARSEEVFDALLDAFSSNPIGGAWRLAAYGDARVVPLLDELLDECLADAGPGGESTDDFLSGIEIGVLADAIVQLGGTLRPDQRAALVAAGFEPDGAGNG